MPLAACWHERASRPWHPEPSHRKSRSCAVLNVYSQWMENELDFKRISRETTDGLALHGRGRARQVSRVAADARRVRAAQWIYHPHSLAGSLVLGVSAVHGGRAPAASQSAGPGD